MIFVTVAILKDWRRGFVFFIAWLLFEDFARKYLGNGTVLWQKDVAYADTERNWNDKWYTNASPATDGQRVVVSFASAGMYCFDFQGKELWKRTDLGKSGQSLRERLIARILRRNRHSLVRAESGAGPQLSPRRRQEIRQKTAVITGGSAGIGLAAAKRFAEEGAYVFITGRRQAELDAAVKEIGPKAVGGEGGRVKHRRSRASVRHREGRQGPDRRAVRQCGGLRIHAVRQRSPRTPTTGCSISTSRACCSRCSKRCR